MSVSENYLLLWSIGGIQELQTSARRTQDAWMRSYVVSWLVARAIVRLRREFGSTISIITPDTTDVPLLRMADGAGDFALEEVLIANVPNVVLLRYSSPKPNPRRVLDVLSAAATEEFQLISREVRCALNLAAPSEDSHLDETVWNRQVESFADRLGFHGCFVPILDGPADKRWDEYCAFSGGARTPYAVAVHSLGRLLAMDKQVRAFTGTGAGGDGLRCSCTLRASLPVDWARWIASGARHVEANDPANFDRAHWGANARSIRGSCKVKIAGRMKATERLCAVCVTLRFAWELYFLPRIRALEGICSSRQTESEWHLLFPSTASMAAAPFVHGILRALVTETADASTNAAQPLRTALRGFLKSLEDVATAMQLDWREAFWASALTAEDRRLLSHIERHHADLELAGFAKQFLWLDGDLLFDDTLQDAFFTADREVAGDRLDAVASALRRARTALTALHRTAAAHRVPALSPYLAVIVFDGDRMGEWLRLPGEWGRLNIDSRWTEDGEVTPEYQVALAKALREFSLDAVSTAVLGNSDTGAAREQPPLGHLIFSGGEDVLALAPASRALQILEHLHKGYELGVSHSVRGDYPNMTMTASAAVLIVKRGDNLGDALHEAYALLKRTAKEAIGRDAYAIAVRTGGGTTTTTGGKWAQLPSVRSVVEAFGDGVSSRLLLAVERAVRDSSLLLDDAVRGDDVVKLGYPRGAMVREDVKGVLRARAAHACATRDVDAANEKSLARASDALLGMIEECVSSNVPAHEMADRIQDALYIAEFVTRNELVTR